MRQNRRHMQIKKYIIPRLREDGFSLLELAVVLTIVGILTGIGYMGYKNWQSTFSVKTAISDIYTDISNAQVKALTKRRMFFVYFSQQAGIAMGATAYNQYSLYEDSYTSPNGDGTLTTLNTTGASAATSDTLLPGYPKKVNYSINLVNDDGTYTACSTGVNSDTNTASISFNSQGLANVQRAIIRLRWTANITPEYDCIFIERTRLTRGIFDATNNVCSPK